MAERPGSLLTGVRVCASVAGESVEPIARFARRCPDADLVEIRWDSLGAAADDPDGLAELVDALPGPLVVTCRPAWQGGAYRGGEANRRVLLERALSAGARWVDIELDAPFCAEMVERHRDRTLVSHHWSEPAPRDLDGRVDRIVELRPAIGKLVAPGRAAEDGVDLLLAAERLRGAGIFPSCFTMGEAGRATRLLSVARSGGLVYVDPGDGRETAPGQWPLEFVRHELRVGHWKPGGQIFGLVGDPIEQSLSPTIFNAVFDAAGRPACYVPIPGSDVEQVLALAEAAGVDGLSVTMPFKEAAARRCARLEGLARRVGAANTLVRHDDGWVGHNTDGGAVVEAVAPYRKLEGARVTILGAGGAARSAAAALMDAGARVTIANRTIARAQRLAAELGCRVRPLDEVQRMRLDVLVNATPVGMGATADVPVSTAGLRGDEVVLDMVYRPTRTELLRQAAARGCVVVPGLEMFLRQATAQHSLWTGELPPRGSLRKAAVERLETDGFR